MVGYPGGFGFGPWVLAGPLWLFFWFFLIGACLFMVGRARRGGWMRRGGWGPGPWGPGGPGAPGGPWGPQAGPDGEPDKPGEPPEHALDRARAILHERYAKGEISTEEYRERIDNLV